MSVTKKSAKKAKELKIIYPNYDAWSNAEQATIDRIHTSIASTEGVEALVQTVASPFGRGRKIVDSFRPYYWIDINTNDGSVGTLTVKVENQVLGKKWRITRFGEGVTVAARLVASFSHPNICIEGEQWMSQVDINTVADYALQMSEALGRFAEDFCRNRLPQAE